MRTLRTAFLIVYLVTTAPLSFAQEIPNTQESEANTFITHLYQNMQHLSLEDKSARIVYISKQFLGKPYELTALGEGSKGYFDQYPLYRTDAFDCETYVDTVLALVFGHDLASFKQYIEHIRYDNGQISFIHRNHFTCLDWNKNNQKQHLVEDITNTLHDRNHHPIACTAHAYIDKPSWYHHFSTNKIRVQQSTPQEQIKRLGLLKQRGKTLPKKISYIPYIPLTALFTKAGDANQYLFNQIPQGAIIEIIRPNWDLTKQIGTHLNVSHLGFAIWEQQVLYFYQASSKEHAVVKSPLIDYLREARTSPTIKGIHIQVAK